MASQSSDYDVSLATAGFGMGLPGSTCAGSDARCMEVLWSCNGWMMDVLRIGTNSGVGIVSPVAGVGWRPVGMVSLEGPPPEEGAAMAGGGCDRLIP